MNEQKVVEPIMLTPLSIPSKKIRAASILFILAGVIGIFTWSSIILFRMIEFEEITLFVLSSCGILFSILCLSSAFFVMTQKKWLCAVICGVLGILNIGFNLFSFIGLILLLLSKKEFT